MQLKAILENYDILFGSTENKLRFTFRENTREWLGGATLEERIDKLEERIKELERSVDPREIEFNQPSSFVGEVIYTVDLQVMTIQLGGRIYNYCSVPQRIFESFEGSPSKGVYYNRSIKNQFNC